MRWWALRSWIPLARRHAHRRPPAALPIWGRRWGYTTTAAKLSGALLDNADLRGARLAGVDLRRVNLKHANLEGAQFELDKPDMHREALETLKLVRQALGIDHDRPAAASARPAKQHLFRRF